MKILFIHHVADMYGASQSLLRLSRALIKDGDEASVILQEDGPLRNALESAGATVRILPELPVLHRNRLKSPISILKLLVSVSKAAKKIDAIIREDKPDLVHSNTATILPAAGRPARRNNVPFIQHYRESFHDFGAIWPLYRSWILKNATRVISISDYLAKQYTDAQRKKYIRVARNGIPIEEFNPPPEEDVKTFRGTWNLTSPVITLIGRIKLKRKGQEVFVAAAALLRDQFPEAMFVIAGTPFPGNESHLDTIKQMVKDSGMEDRVIFTGHIEDVRVVLANTDISVMASSTPEPLGNVTMESMAMEVPVVGTSIGGTPELMKDGETGLLVPPSDPQAMAEAIAKLLNDPSLTKAMGQAGRKHFVENLSYQPFYNRIRSIYSEILEEQSSPK